MNFGKDPDEKLATLGFVKLNENMNVIGSSFGTVTYERQMPFGETQVVAIVKNLSGRFDLRSYDKSTGKAIGIGYTELELFIKKMKIVGANK